MGSKGSKRGESDAATGRHKKKQLKGLVQHLKTSESLPSNLKTTNQQTNKPSKIENHENLQNVKREPAQIDRPALAQPRGRRSLVLPSSPRMTKTLSEKRPATVQDMEALCEIPRVLGDFKEKVFLNYKRRCLFVVVFCQFCQGILGIWFVWVMF